MEISLFVRGLARLSEEGRLYLLAEEIQEKLKDKKIELKACRDLVDVYRAQGAIEALENILEIPEKILGPTEENNDRTTD